MRLFRLSITVFFLLFALVLNAQTGFIRGTVFDDSNGESLPGSTVAVDGTTMGTITDLDGNFNIKIAPGTYTLKVSFISYETLVISDVEVKADDVSILDNVRLKESKIELGEVTVTAKQIRNTEAALNTIKMKSASVMDGISASSLRKIGDSDAASSIKRVAGVSVEGGKYVFVRGLGDRYTKTTLNGADIPGLDPDRNTLQMDIFPTNIIDNIIVHKSFTPDLPADFTGGVIDIAIKDFPEERQGKFSVSAGYNPGSHFNSNYLTYDGGATDWLGYDDGARDIPAESDIPDFTTAAFIDNAGSGPRYRAILENFNPTMAAMKENSFMDYSIGASFGNQISLDKLTLGFNVALSYKNSTDFYEDAEFGRYGRNNTSPDEYELQMRTHRLGDYGVNRVFVSGLAGFAIKSKNSKIRVNLMHLQNGESQAGIFDFQSRDLGSEFDAFQHTLLYTQRSLSNILLDGKHSLAEGNWEIEWKLSPTLSKMKDPDIRFTRYAYRQLGDPNSGLVANTESGFPERRWRDLEEKNLAGLAHFTKKFGFNGEDAKLKFGGAHTYKERDFKIQIFTINLRDVPLTGDPNELFSEENLWPMGGDVNYGTTYEASFIPENANKFNAKVNHTSGYVSAELSLFRNMKTIVGVRMENYVQNYTGNILEDSTVLDQLDYFPSVNLIYSLTEKMNLRFSYTKTIARPSLKELSFAEIVDPISGMTFIGGLFDDEDPVSDITYWDGNLVSTDIHNFDLRWEAYQDNGQMVSVSAFYKQFYKPIEMVQYSTTQKTTIQPRNVGEGSIVGGEIEFRQSLGRITPALRNFTALANFTYIQSRIKMNQAEYDSRQRGARTGETIDEYRKMAGQAPYLINAGIAYNGGENGIWNGLEAGFYYNVQGETLQYVGIADKPDVYSRPFHSLNFNSNKSIGAEKKFQIGLKVTNILNSMKESVFKSYEAEDQFFKRLDPGTTFTIRLAYKFL